MISSTPLCGDVCSDTFFIPCKSAADIHGNSMSFNSPYVAYYSPRMLHCEEKLMYCRVSRCCPETRVDKLGHINLAREMRHDDIEVENELDLVTDDDIDDKEEDVEDEDEENDTLFNLFGHDASLGARYVEPPERESYEDSEDHSRHHGSEAPSPERGDPQAPQYA